MTHSIEKHFDVIVNVNEDGAVYVDFIENESGDCCGYCTTVQEAMKNEYIGKELASWIMLMADEMGETKNA